MDGGKSCAGIIWEVSKVQIFVVAFCGWVEQEKLIEQLDQPAKKVQCGVAFCVVGGRELEQLLE